MQRIQSCNLPVSVYEIQNLVLCIYFSNCRYNSFLSKKCEKSVQPASYYRCIVRDNDELFLYVTLLGLSMGDLQLLIKHFCIIYGYFFIINSLWLLFIKAELSQERPRFRNLSHGPRKTGVLRFFLHIYGLKQSEKISIQTKFLIQRAVQLNMAR